MNHLSQCWSEAFFHLPKCLLLLLVFAYIYISQGSVEMHLLCGKIYNNCIIANWLKSVPVKKFLKIGQQLAKIWTAVKWHIFLWPVV